MAIHPLWGYPAFLGRAQGVPCHLIVVCALMVGLWTWKVHFGQVIGMYGYHYAAPSSLFHGNTGEVLFFTILSDTGGPHRMSNTSPDTL